MRDVSTATFKRRREGSPATSQLIDPCRTPRQKIDQRQTADHRLLSALAQAPAPCPQVTHVPDPCYHCSSQHTSGGACCCLALTPTSLTGAQAVSVLPRAIPTDDALRIADFLCALPSRSQPSLASAPAPRKQLPGQSSALARRTAVMGGGSISEAPVSSRLDAIVVQHLRHQHRAACLRSAAPTTTLPPMSLLKRHELPQVRTHLAWRAPSIQPRLRSLTQVPSLLAPGQSVFRHATQRPADVPSRLVC